MIVRSIVCDVQIRPAVTVVVAADNAETRAFAAGPQHLPADVFEAATAEIVEQGVSLGRETLWTAVVRTRRGLDAAVGPVLHVVGDEQVQPAVTVVVEERRAHAP